MRLVGFGISGGGPGFDDLRFTSAPLFVQTEGHVVFEGCHFTGPVDTAVTLNVGYDTPVSFRNCIFRDVGRGIVPVDLHNSADALLVRDCIFERVGEAAIDFRQPLDAPNSGQLGSMSTADNLFVNCAKAIRWRPSLTGGVTVHMRRDSIVACGDTAIVIAGPAWLDSITIRDGNGPAIYLESRHNFAAAVVMASRVLGSTVRNNRGHGLVWVDTLLSIIHTPGIVSGNEFVNNQGDGAHIDAAGIYFRKNLFARNAGAGLRWNRQVEQLGHNKYYFGDTLYRNTSVANNGDGFHLIHTQPEWPGIRITNNLAAGNDGAGFQRGGTAPHEQFRGNDAWLNSAGNYNGFAAGGDNLEGDPRFCNVYNGDYHVQESSPCAPSGPYGQIGAFGVGCTSSHVELASLRGSDDHAPNATGQLKVALLGHRLFDPSSVDMASLRLGGARPSEHAGNQHGVRVRDVSGDGIDDAVVAFPGAEMVETVNGKAVLTGMMLDGSALSGGIEVREVGRGREAEPMAAGELKLEIRSITPNPSSGRFVLEFASPGRASAELSLYDIAGRRVRNTDLGTAAGVRRIEVSGVKPGVYFGVVTVGSESVRKRVVVR